MIDLTTSEDRLTLARIILITADAIEQLVNFPATGFVHWAKDNHWLRDLSSG